MKKFDGETLKNPLLFEESRPSLAILFMIAAMFLISLVDSFCKAFTDELHAVQLVWGYFVGIFAALCLYFVFRRLGFRALAHTNRMGLHWFRSGCLVGSIMSLFVGLTYMPIADATAIGFMAPLFITILSIPLLNEKVGTHRWIAVVAGLNWCRHYHPAWWRDLALVLNHALDRSLIFCTLSNNNTCHHEQ